MEYSDSCRHTYGDILSFPLDRLPGEYLEERLQIKQVSLIEVKIHQNSSKEFIILSFAHDFEVL